MSNENQSRSIPKLFENAAVVPLYPALVIALGDMLKALIVAQIHFGAQKSGTVDAQNCAWCEVTYDELGALFGAGWATVQRHVKKLEEDGVLISQRLKDGSGKRYRVDYGCLYALTNGQSWIPDNLTPGPSPQAERGESGANEGENLPDEAGENDGHQNDVPRPDSVKGVYQNDVPPISKSDTPPYQNDIPPISKSDTPIPLRGHQNDVPPLYIDSFKRLGESFKRGEDMLPPPDEHHPLWVAFCEGFPAGTPEPPAGISFWDTVGRLEAQAATADEVRELVAAKWREPSRSRYAFRMVAEDLADWRARAAVAAGGGGTDEPVGEKYLNDHFAGYFQR